MEPTTPPTFTQRAAAFVIAAEAARGAPFIPSGLRDALAGVAEFASAVAEELTELRELLAASTAAEAALLDKLAEQDARIDALEAAATPQG